MSGLGSARSIVELTQRVAEDGVDAVLSELGRFLLVGEIDQHEASSWAFATSTMISPAVATQLGVGFDFDRGLVYAIEKRTATFPNVILLGRSRSNDVQIEHHSISKLHARIHLADDAFELEDAGSLNGTWVGGVRVEQPITVSSGDRIGFGVREFTVQRSRTFVDVLRRIGPL